MLGPVYKTVSIENEELEKGMGQKWTWVKMHGIVKV